MKLAHNVARLQLRLGLGHLPAGLLRCEAVKVALEAVVRFICEMGRAGLVNERWDRCDRELVELRRVVRIDLEVCLRRDSNAGLSEK